MLCPCGTKKLYSECCLPLITKATSAKYPEQLMRSRYTAYCQNMPQYIFDTYAKSSQKSQSVAEIAQWGESCRWVKLTIHDASQLDTEKYPENKNQTSQEILHTVYFSAFYLIKDTLLVLSECSRFLKEETNEGKSEWRYLDGEVFKHEEILRLKRNDSCPCESGKKFKKCCG
jgi:SEC-C motif-containing protein